MYFGAFNKVFKLKYTYFIPTENRKGIDLIVSYGFIVIIRFLIELCYKK